jgi:CelD/BcsL family acetyltransferase involved in cellulose biosynthesis
MKELIVRHLEPHEADSWDNFVVQSPQGSLFHTVVWKSIISKALAPHCMRIITCSDETGFLGGCVFLEKERLGAQTAVTPLLTPYCGFILDGPPGEKLSDQISRDHAVLGALTEYMMEHYPYINLASPPHLEDIRPFQQHGFTIIPRFTYVLNLRLSPEEHWERFDGSVRRQIKKAEREEFEICDRLPVERAYELFEATFTRRGEKCPVPFQLFECIARDDKLADYRQVFTAWAGGTLVSFVIILLFDKKIYYAVAASDPDYLCSGVSSLLIWEIIKQYAGTDWNHFDFVGANIPSIARFKENFNPRLQMYFQLEYYASSYLKLGKELLDRLRG